MKILNVGISAENKIYIKDFIIQDAIKNKHQYVEMEDEILIDTDILIRIRCSEKIIISEQMFKSLEIIGDKLLLEHTNYENKQNKKDLRKQSRLVNNKIKNYNQRRR